MKYLPLSFLLFAFCLCSISAQAQEDSTDTSSDDLMALLEDQVEEPIDYAFATFKGVRVVNGHSVEMPAFGELQIQISHRFGRLNGGFYELFGLDQANIRIGAQYGILDWLSVGVGRSNVEKTYDGFVKARFLRQSKGKRFMPITAVWVSGVALNTLRWQFPERENYFSSRLTYSHQLLVSRKVTDGFSVQLMPTMVHRNLVQTDDEQNDVFAVGIGARQKITKSISINLEYYYVLPGNTADNFRNSLSIGFDVETGGHVFQFIFSNSRGITNQLFVPKTTGNWLDGDIHFGFNIGRAFSLVK